MKTFIVVFDDEQGLCAPMTWDQECEGAIEAASYNEKIATFPSRKAANKAISISVKNAALREAQGKTANTDFTESRKFVRVRELDMGRKESE